MNSDDLMTLDFGGLPRPRVAGGVVTASDAALDLEAEDFLGGMTKDRVED